VKTALGISFHAKRVILTNGTFLNGLIHVGRVNFPGGRAAEPATSGLSVQLQTLGFTVGRMKTGTPVRIDGKSVDFSKLTRQDGDNDFHRFSFLNFNHPHALKMRPCYIAYTNSDVHDILREGFSDSPLFNGTIKSIGPRYCPSIETKLETFSDKDSHHLFLEPEGESTTEYYLNGFSSSLPWNIQWEALRRVKGLERVKIYRPGYAIEYDFFPPTQLFPTLETKFIQGLYFAGQINGTTGYEEAAAQGLMAGINAHLSLHEKSHFILKRDQAYIGVLIDDLVTKGVDEPYRMFTSRAEYRVLLRQDNADARLTPLGHSLGLATSERYAILSKKMEQRDAFIDFLQNTSVTPGEINHYLESIDSSPIRQKVKIVDIIARPQITLWKLLEVLPLVQEFISARDMREEIIESAEILIKYSGYIERERLIADKLGRLENLVIAGKFDYHSISSLSMEAREKLSKIQPLTIGQASRITGVSPSDINALLILMGR
jgi:tRNA uridine 5-carboxymethylaminomethyl modification enzyme